MFCQALVRIGARHWKKVSMGYADALNGDTSDMWTQCAARADIDTAVTKIFRVDMKKKRSKKWY